MKDVHYTRKGRIITKLWVEEFVAKEAVEAKDGKEAKPAVMGYKPFAKQEAYPSINAAKRASRKLQQEGYKMEVIRG